MKYLQILHEVVEVVVEWPAPYFSDGSISTLSPPSCQGSAKANSTKLNVETKKPWHLFHNILISMKYDCLFVILSCCFFSGKRSDLSFSSSTSSMRRQKSECLFICSMWVIWLSSQTNLIGNWSRKDKNGNKGQGGLWVKDLIEHNWIREDGGGNRGYDGLGDEIIPKLGKMNTRGDKGINWT